MYKICKTKSSRKRQQMVEQELLYMMQRQEFSQIKVSELCERVGMPRKSFYMYFETKDDVLTALIDHAIQGFHDYSIFNRNTPDSTTYRELKRYFEYWKENANLLNGLRRSRLSGLLVLRTVECLVEWEKQSPFLLWGKEIRPSEEAILYTVSGLLTIVLNWHNNSFEKSVEEMAEIATELLTKSLFQDIKG